MITVWIKRTRAKKILCLVRFNYLPNYFEVSFHYFWRRCNKKIKLKPRSLDISTYYRSLSKIPEGYSGKNVIFMERNIIYNHEVVKEILSRWKLR
jgi:hypothetical protein